VSWSPDGQHLAFAGAATPDEPGGIFVMALEGGTARRLTPVEVGTLQTGPAFSPDGRSLAFVSASPAPDTICIVRLDDGYRALGPARVLARRSGNVIVGTAWTKDGEGIVFGEARYGVAPRLWKVGIHSGSQPALLAFAGPGSIYPAVARTGFRLAYSQSFFDNDLWSFRDGVLIRSPLSSTLIDRNPQFSPDGTKVAFASDRSGKAEIWLANSDGSSTIQLTFSRASGTPRWSPDGRWIVYDTQDDNGRWDVYVLDAAGGTPIPVVRHPADDNTPSFSGDGKWIYFASNRSGRYEIYRTSSRGGEPVKLTDNGGWTAFESADRKSIYYSKLNFKCGGPLFRRSLDGGPERQVIASVCARGFAVLENGIYYVAGYREVKGTPFWPIPIGRTDQVLSVRLFDPGTGQTLSMVAGKADRPLQEPFSLAVSREGRAILLSAASHTGTDLYLAENFRQGQGGR
jgi:Tol biopolymer transport system component